VVSVATEPITDTERARVAELHAAGRSRNDIAAELGRSGSTISKIAGRLGLTFNRARVAAATDAKVVDAKAKRAQLMNDLLDDAQRLRQQLWSPTTVYSFGGKDNTYASHDVPLPPVRDQRDIVQAVNTALSAALRLDQHDGDGTTDQAGSLLGALFDSITGRHAEAPAPADGDG
jgi:IS30 family transposase